MNDNNADPYSAPAARSPTAPSRFRELLRWWPITLPVFLLPFPAIFIFVSATAPYRPPHDLNSLLGAGEVELAYSLSAMFVVVWLICGFVFVKRLYKLFAAPETLLDD
jgi:hypothetical protein